MVADSTSDLRVAPKLKQSKCVGSAWVVLMVRRHVGAHTGQQNERLTSSRKVKEVQKDPTAMCGGGNTLGREAAGVEVAGW